jgi:hypothetical protein
MVYVVHEVSAKRAEGFTKYAPAFIAFKRVLRFSGTAALWHGNDVEGWRIVYASQHYPTELKRPPYVSPHSFWVKD